MSAARRHVILGAAGIALAAAFGAYVLSGLGGHPGGPFQVTVTFARVGQLLRVSGDVRLRGVQVGKVAQIAHNGDGTARVLLCAASRRRNGRCRRARE